MKRNLLSVFILVLLVVNIVLSAVTMFSVTSTNKKTAGLVMKIASALDMEIGEEEITETVAVSMEDTEMYDIADSMTIPLKKSGDGKDHYYVVSVSFAMNVKGDGYKTYGETISSKESLIKGEIIDVIGSYTLEEIQVDAEAVKKEVLARIQKMFESDFIYQVTFSDVKYS